MKPRRLTAEILDGLPSDQPSAQRSRRDLLRVHRALGTCRQLAGALRINPIMALGPRPVRILEIGAGDGRLMLAVAQRLHRQVSQVELTLLDRLDVVEPATLSAYSQLGWSARSWVADVLDWAQPASHEEWDMVVANLFLHHFDDRQLAALLSAVAARARYFLAYEPRRAWPATVGSHLIGALGVGAVTRSDAKTSVVAGFRDSEITALWPGDPGHWTLQERPAGLFSHCFRAERTAAFRSRESNAARL